MKVLTLPGKTILPPRNVADQPFDFPTELVGKTTDVTVYYDPSLGAPGLANAKALLAVAQKVFEQTATWFGIAGKPIIAVVAAIDGSTTDGTAGAYHYGCDFQTGGTLYIDAAFGNSPIVIGLYEAELSEAFMGAQGKGWNCGGSGGEALSRWLAEAVSGGPNGALAAFTSAPSWHLAGRPNWIDKDQGTDQDYPSIGCGMVYLSWMTSLNYTIDQITKAGGKTLAANYKALTGKSTAWADLTAALAAVASITNDDPFAGANPRPAPQPTPQPAPQPAPQPTNEPLAMIDEIGALLDKIGNLLDETLGVLSNLRYIVGGPAGHEDPDPQP
jgi:hypothetical protein